MVQAREKKSGGGSSGANPCAVSGVGDFHVKQLE